MFLKLGTRNVPYKRKKMTPVIGITRTRSKHDYKIRPKVARTNYIKYLFFHRYINDWNSVASNVMSSPILQSDQVPSLIIYLKILGIVS